jgi:RimJ/RimL family protein N-acetyltransferase
MITTNILLPGAYVRLEALDPRHIDGLTAASAVDPSLYQWSLVPVGSNAVRTYVESALALRDAGTTVPFAIVRLSDERVIGSSRFFDIETWPWPEGHPRHNRGLPDAAEIGYTWFTADAIRTAANTETKLMMLTHAFEQWGMLRVCFHTDERNERSRAALARIGAQFEGILRAHRMASDFTPRNSARFSIVASEWPDVKRRLTDRLGRP